MRMVHTSHGKAGRMAIMAYTKAGKKAYRAEFEYKGKRYTKAGFRTQGDAKDWTAAEKRRVLLKE